MAEKNSPLTVKNLAQDQADMEGPSRWRAGRAEERRQNDFYLLSCLKTLCLFLTTLS